MTSIKEELDQAKERLAALEQVTNVQKKAKDKKLQIKIPIRLLRKAKAKPEKSVGVFMYHNREAEFKEVTYRDGLLYCGEQSFTYEPGCCYQLKYKRKRIPLYVIYEWSMIPEGGKTAEYRNRLVGTEFDKDLAEKLGVKSAGQQTIIRRIEQAEVDKEGKQKKPLGGMIIWIIVIVIIIYLASKLFGGA